MFIEKEIRRKRKFFLLELNFCDLKKNPTFINLSVFRQWNFWIPLRNSDF
jgi:hypothetical protein